MNALQINLELRSQLAETQIDDGQASAFDCVQDFTGRGGKASRLRLAFGRYFGIPAGFSCSRWPNRIDAAGRIRF